MNWQTFTNNGIDAIVINSCGDLTFYDKWQGLFAIGHVTNLDEDRRTIQIYYEKGSTDVNRLRKPLRELICYGDKDIFKEYLIIPTCLDYDKWKEVKRNQKCILL